MAILEMKIRLLLLSLSISILAAILYFSDVSKVLMVVAGANPYYVLLAFSLAVFLMTVRTFRWKILLARVNVRVAYAKLFASYMSGMLVSNMTPGKIGEPFKSYVLKKTSGIPISKTLPSVFMEKIFDVFSTIILALLGIVIVALPQNVENVLFVVTALYLLAVAAILYVGTDKKRIYSFSKKMMRLFGWLPFARRFEKSIEHFAERFNESLAHYKDLPVTLKNFVLSMFVWSAEGVILYVCFLSVGVSVSLLAVISFLSISVLIGATSLLPGGIGSSEIVLVLLFTATYALPLPSVTAAVFMARFFSLWLNVIVGSVCISSLKLNLK